jgi:hypothetical protein
MKDHYFLRNRDGAVDIETTLRSGWSGVRIPAQGERFFSFPKCSGAL